MLHKQIIYLYIHGEKGVEILQFDWKALRYVNLLLRITLLILF